MGERPRFARLLAIADLISTNRLPGTLTIVSMVDFAFQQIKESQVYDQ